MEWLWAHVIAQQQLASFADLQLKYQAARGNIEICLKLAAWKSAIGKVAAFIDHPGADMVDIVQLLYFGIAVAAPSGCE